MFNQTKAHKQYTIHIQSASGNTIGTVFLSSQFLKAVVGKPEEQILASDITNINGVDLAEYLASANFVIEEVVPKTTTSIHNY